MKFSLLLYIDTFIPFLWISLTRQNEKKGSDFPSTLVISEKLDFFEIPSKLLEKVLLEIQPSQLVMPSILVSSRKKRLKIHHCHLHYLLNPHPQESIWLAEAQTLVTTLPPLLGHLCFFIILCTAMPRPKTAL